TVGKESNGQYVAASLTIIDLTSSFQKTYSISAQLSSITDFAISGASGLHHIEMTDGTITKDLFVTILDPTNEGTLPSFIQTVLYNPSPKITDPFVINVTLFSPDQDWLVMSGNEGLYLKSNGVINSPIFSNYWFSNGQFVSFPFSVNFTVSLPVWHLIGNMEFTVGFTGNNDLHHNSTNTNILLISSDFTLSVLPSTDQIDRSSFNSPTTINVSLLLGGQNFPLDQLYYQIFLKTTNGTSVITNSFVVASRTMMKIITIPTQIGIGDAKLIIDLLDINSNLLFSNYTSILIYDTVGLTINPTEPHLAAGENTTVLALTYIHDRPNTPLEANITVKNGSTIITAGNTFNGEYSFVLNAPTNSNLGVYTLSWDVQPIGVNTTLIRSCIFFTQFVVNAGAEFLITNLPTQVFRNTNLNFNVQLHSNGYPITGNAGYYQLIQIANNEILGNYLVNKSNTISLTISKDYPKGAYPLRLYYDGNTLYTPVEKDLSVKILSQPFITNVTTNTTGVIAGDTIKISGYLVEENSGNTAVFNQSIEIMISDGVSSWIDGSAITDSHGAFAYFIKITNDLRIGVHFIRLVYSGDPDNYYGSSSNQPIVNFDHNNPLTIEFANQLIANNLFNFTVTGNILAKYNLEYLNVNNNLSQYKSLVNITLDKFGKGQFTTIAPNKRGLIYFRLIAIDDNSSFVINEQTVLVKPTGKITIPSIIESETSNILSFTSSEPYVVYLNDIRLTPASQVWEGQQSLEYSFNFPGVYSLKLQYQSYYLTFTNITSTFTVYEAYSVSKVIPSNIVEGSDISVDISLSGKVIGPLDNINVEIINNRTLQVLAQGLTGATGSVQLHVTVIGSAQEIILHIPAQDVGKYHIQEKNLLLTTSIRRKLDLSVQQTYEFIKNDKNILTGNLYYYSSKLPASDVSLTVKIFSSDILIQTLTVNSASQGVVSVDIGFLDKGEYQIFFSPNSTEFAPFVVITQVTISGVNETTDFINIVFLGLGGVTVLTTVVAIRVFKGHPKGN
ncbi:MAG: hypothetical protein ACFFD1_10725, partial [Candidatus Thorarchaeota archaeon]